MSIINLRDFFPWKYLSFVHFTTSEDRNPAIGLSVTNISIAKGLPVCDHTSKWCEEGKIKCAAGWMWAQPIKESVKKMYAGLLINNVLILMYFVFWCYNLLFMQYFWFRFLSTLGNLVMKDANHKYKPYQQMLYLGSSSLQFGVNFAALKLISFS